MTHMAVSGDTPAAAGFHDLIVSIYMESTGGQARFEAEPIRRQVDHSEFTANHHIFNRVTVGIRNARALVLL